MLASFSNKSTAEKQLDESKKQSKTLDKIAESTEIMTSKESGGDDLIMR